MDFTEIFKNKTVSFSMQRDVSIKGCTSLIQETMKTLGLPFEEAVLYVKDSITAQVGYHSQLSDHWVDLAAEIVKKEQNLT